MDQIEHFAADSETARRARDVLQRKVDAARASAANVLETVHTQLPTDQIATGPKFMFSASPVTPSLVVNIGNSAARTIHPHALGQLATTADIPAQYLRELALSSDGWKRELAARTLADHFGKGNPSARRYLVRSVTDQVRGVLSDRYRRLDSRPLLDAFIEEASALGAVPIDGHVTDTRVAMKAILPHVFEPIPGEAIALGFEWGNSDFGAARHSGRAYILRLWCLNGATTEDALSQVHLGKQLNDDIEFSRQTYALDTRHSVSALRDIVRGTLGPVKVEKLLTSIKAAHEAKVTWKGVAGKLGAKLTKGELETARLAFESEDVINLPAEPTLWRASNALSWIAGKSENEDRKLELQRMAGQVLNGQADKIEAA